MDYDLTNISLEDFNKLTDDKNEPGFVEVTITSFKRFEAEGDRPASLNFNAVIVESDADPSTWKPFTIRLNYFPNPADDNQRKRTGMAFRDLGAIFKAAGVDAVSNEEGKLDIDSTALQVVGQRIGLRIKHTESKREDDDRVFENYDRFRSVS